MNIINGLPTINLTHFFSFQDTNSFQDTGVINLIENGNDNDELIVGNNNNSFYYTLNLSESNNLYNKIVTELTFYSLNNSLLIGQFYDNFILYKEIYPSYIDDKETYIFSCYFRSNIASLKIKLSSYSEAEKIIIINEKIINSFDNWKKYECYFSLNSKIEIDIGIIFCIDDEYDIEDGQNINFETVSWMITLAFPPITNNLFIGSFPHNKLYPTPGLVLSNIADTNNKSPLVINNAFLSNYDIRGTDYYEPYIFFYDHKKMYGLEITDTNSYRSYVCLDTDISNIMNLTNSFSIIIILKFLERTLPDSDGIAPIIGRASSSGKAIFGISEKYQEVSSNGKINLGIGFVNSSSNLFFTSVNYFIDLGKWVILHGSYDGNYLKLNSSKDYFNSTVSIYKGSGSLGNYLPGLYIGNFNFKFPASPNFIFSDVLVYKEALTKNKLLQILYYYKYNKNRDL